MAFNHACRRFCFHVYSLWLFSWSDLKTIVFPQTTFAVLSALSKARPESRVYNSKEQLIIIQRTPLVLLWVWINLIPFEINNQRQSKDIAEDGINKPWRTLPSGRWTSRQATHVMILFYLLAIAMSWYVGGLRWSMILLFLGAYTQNVDVS
jgi:hypothetical protein